MVTIDTLICQNANPFNDNDLIAGHFWSKQECTITIVDSIHQEEIKKIEFYLDAIAQDHYSRSLLLLGDSGSGKSYLLGRLKRQFNNKAFFVYIDPWVDSRFIWQHILRRTVDSLLYVPEKNQESQLILWLKSLSIVKDASFFQRLFNIDERQRFIRGLRNIYSHGIANAREFFGVLYDLMNPNLFTLACDWLRGDNLAEEDLRELKVNSSVNNEVAARAILDNLGRISIETFPIILCFDQLDNIPLSPSGFIDLQSLFNFNSNIHTQGMKNFLIIITMPTSTWQNNEIKIQPADLAPGRIHDKVILKQINRQQIVELWKLKLSSLHAQASPQHFSSLHPLTDDAITINFSSGRTLPRSALVIAKKLYQTYKDGICPSPIIDKDELLKQFKIRWEVESQKIKTTILKVNQLTVLELVKMLAEVLQALNFNNIQIRGTNNNVDSCYLNFNRNQEKICLFWTEDPGLNNFYHVMRFCEREISNQVCNRLYLLRNATIGNHPNRGYTIHQTIFRRPPHRHFHPTLTSIHYLATHHQLVMAAKSKNLVVAGKDIDLPTLKELLHKSQILENCQLLQDLELVTKSVNK